MNDEDETVSFAIGDLITGQLRGVTTQAAVLDKDENRDRLLLMTIPGGEVTELAAQDLGDWTYLPIPEVRWVEVYEGDAETPFFAAYLPDFAAAAAIYRAFEAIEGDFKVEIYTNDDRENELLDGMGYFGNVN